VCVAQVASMQARHRSYGHIVCSNTGRGEMELWPVVRAAAAACRATSPDRLRRADLAIAGRPRPPSSPKPQCAYLLLVGHSSSLPSATQDHLSSERGIRYGCVLTQTSFAPASLPEVNKRRDPGISQLHPKAERTLA
jgi:hypothetical protein